MRVEALRETMVQADIDGYVVSNRKNIYYLTGFMDIAGAALHMLIPLDGDATLITKPLSFTAASAAARNCHVQAVGIEEKIADRLLPELQAHGTSRLGFDDLSIPTYVTLARALGRGNLTQRQEMIWALRRTKDAREIASMRGAAKLADVGVETGIEAIKPGVREYEVAAELEYAMRVRGSKGTAFETVVASGPRSALPHGICGDRVIRDGDLVVLDLGAVCGEYRSDVTRTVVAGTPSPTQRRLLRIVSETQETAFSQIHVGKPTRDVDAVARGVLAGEDCGRYFIHGLGHGVGLDIHEPPTLSPQSREVLERGNVVTVEPGIYIPEFGGVRIEDTVYVDDVSGEKLTRAGYHLSE
jgi:Xaa-Pro aminopeptidase